MNDHRLFRGNPDQDTEPGLWTASCLVFLWWLL